MNRKKSPEEQFFISKKYEDFIIDFEDKWLQFASPQMRIEAFFGDINNAKKLFKKWKSGIDIFENERKIAFSK